MALQSDRSISIVFPAYNEEDNIEDATQQAMICAESLFKEWEIIVVNDGSTDRTGEIIDRLSREEARIRPIHHEGNGGYGIALRSGIARATKELVFFCDSDLQFHLSELVLLLTWIERFDLVIGYRVQRHDPFYRRCNAWGWRQLVRLMLGLKVRDIDCAFKLFRREVFDTIRIDAVGAMVNTDILVQALRMNFAIKEVPVTHFPRMKGDQSGANLRVIIKAFRELVQLHHKLSNIRPRIIDHARRDRQLAFSGADRRIGVRRKNMLCINFPDRRLRVGIPPPPAEVSAQPDGSRLPTTT